MGTFESPIPLSDIESVLAWVDTFKLSRNTKKINRDFSDAVLLAEILSVHYPKLVEMHNYPPRNSHAMKLNNWLTLNRKVLKKLKLNLCADTMEHLANCSPGVIERVLVMVRDKIHRDEEANKAQKEAEQNMSSGGSYYEACGEEENVLVVPIKTRVTGVLETIHQKVVIYEAYVALKEELKDAKDTSDVLKQKVEHLDNLLKLKDERIEELQKQLERKQARRKEAEAYVNSLSVPFDTSVSASPRVEKPHTCKLTAKPGESSFIRAMKVDDSKIPIPKLDESKILHHKSEDIGSRKKAEDSKIPVFKSDNSKIPVTPEEQKKSIAKTDSNALKRLAKNNDITINDIPTFEEVYSITEVQSQDKLKLLESNFMAQFNVPKSNTENKIPVEVDLVKSDIFMEIENGDMKELYKDTIENYKDSEPVVVTIEETIQKEIRDISNPITKSNNYINPTDISG